MQVTKTLIDKCVELCGSNRKLAERLGVSHQLPTHWKQGHSIPSREQVVDMAFMAGVDARFALLQLDLEALEKTEKGRQQLEEMKRRFLGIGAGISRISNVSAGPLTDELRQAVVDTLYIVSTAIRTLVSKTGFVFQGAMPAKLARLNIARIDELGTPDPVQRQRQVTDVEAAWWHWPRMGRWYLKRRAVS